MRKGFKFNHNKCVGCQACSAACILENGWDIQPRKIYTYNTDAISALPVVNLSLACNHCEKPYCLEGCPAGSYHRDIQTGAIIIDDSSCIGCRYCLWNCPYDAPKLNNFTGLIGKCNLCYSGLIEGRLPACVDGCPTGALGYGDISENIVINNFSWFPDRYLNPAIELSEDTEKLNLRIIPEKSTETEITGVPLKPVISTADWSLIAFSFLVTLSVASMISSLLKGIFPNKTVSIGIIVLAGAVSLLHLGRITRAWKAVINFRTSPLSREIAVYLAYAAISSFALICGLPALLIAASVTGLILLILIDNVYVYADRRNSRVIHSGQTFLSSLLIISFLTGSVIPFGFIAIIKAGSSIYNIYSNKSTSYSYGIRFLRLALLLITGISMFSGISVSDPGIIAIFLAGELLDRILYYIDFEPVNIRTTIYKHSNKERYEKKRG